MWKQWCGIGKNTGLQTDWHPVALSIHITAVDHCRAQDSWWRWIIPPLVWFLAWKCPSLALTHCGIAGLLLQDVPPQPVGQCSESPFLVWDPACAEATCSSWAWRSLSEYLWFQGVSGGHGGWKHCSLHRAVAMQLKAVTALSFLHHSMSLSTHWCLAFIAKPLWLVLCNLFRTEVLSF